METTMIPGTAVRGPMKQAGGYTLLEMVLALAMLSLGSAVLWYTLRSSARLDKMNELHHQANMAARSELEALRSMPRQDIRDTAYRLPGPGGEDLLVMREVFDSTRIMATLEEITLDEKLAPVELRKPLEIRVRVFQAGEGEEDGWGIPDAWSGWGESGTDGESRRLLSSLVLKIPEYRWH